MAIRRSGWRKTSEYRRVLCPTDFSSAANLGVEKAARLAVKDQAVLLLLHVLTPVTTYAAAEIPGAALIPFVDQWREEARDELYRVRDQLRQAGVATHALMAEGNPSEQIPRLAKRLRCGLIVLAASGRTGLVRMLLGSSVPERVVRRAHCPVLVYHASQTRPTHQHVATPQKVAA